MTIARVTAHDAVGSTSAAFGGTPTAGNLLLCSCVDIATGTTLTGWTSIVTKSAGGAFITLFAKTSAGTEGTVAPTAGAGGFIFSTTICEYSGTKNPYAADGTADGVASNTGSPTSLASPAITTTDASSLIFLVGHVEGAVTGLAWSGGPTLFNTNSDAGMKVVHGQYIPGSTQSGFTSTLSWTQPGGNPQFVLIAGFKGVAPTTNIKTIAGLTRSSVKTVAGLPIASVKTIGGLA